MTNRDPVREGFHAAAQRPSVVVAEIAWRWSFGAAAWVLIVLGAHMVLSSVPISRAELDLARRSGIFQAADFLARFLLEAWPRILRVSAVLLPAVAALWIAAASLGRAATLQALTGADARVSPLLPLHFLRAAATLAAAVGYVGAMLVAGVMIPSDPRQAGWAVLVWVAIVIAVVCCWAVVNWFLALAPVFIVRDRMPTFAAIAASIGLARSRPGEYLRIATWFGMFRSAAIAAVLVLSVLAAAGGPAGAVAIVALALAYFAVADWLYVCRLAAYLALSAPEIPQPPVVAEPLPPVAPAVEP